MFLKDFLQAWSRSSQRKGGKERHSVQSAWKGNMKGETYIFQHSLSWRGKMAQARMYGLFTVGLFLLSLDRYLCVLWAAGHSSHFTFFCRYLQSNNANPEGSKMGWVTTLLHRAPKGAPSLLWVSASPNEGNWTKPSLETSPGLTFTEVIRNGFYLLIPPKE